MHRPRDQKAEDQKKKPDDKGYNSSLAKMPDRKYDPWQNIRQFPGHTVMAAIL
jgi:hypothetical protein